MRTPKGFDQWLTDYYKTARLIVDKKEGETRIRELERQKSVLSDNLTRSKRSLRRARRNDDTTKCLQLESNIGMIQNRLTVAETDIGTLRNRLSPDFTLKDPQEVYQELMKHAEIDSIRVDGTRLYIRTTYLKFRDKKKSPIGKILLVMRSDDGWPSTRFENLSYPNLDNAHPHVAGYGALCSGDYSEEIWRYWRSGELYFVIDTLLIVLKKPGSRGTPFSPRSRWKKEVKRQESERHAG